MLKINLLGRPKIEKSGENLDSRLSCKTLALIYMLIINRGKYLARDKIMLYLWPDSAEEAARYNLRYNLWLFRKVIPTDRNGQTLVVTGKDTCTINMKYEFECDWITIKDLDYSSCSLEQLKQVRNLFTGEILEGWYLKGCNEFNEMILFERMLCESKHMEVLQCLASKYNAESNYSKALAVLKEKLILDPDNEETAYEIMETYAKAGNRAAAINQYKSFETALWNDLSITPSERLRELYGKLSVSDKGSGRNGKNGGKNRPKNAGKENDKPLLTIKGHCMNGVDYFLVAEIISKAVKQMDKRLLADFDASFVSDICYIQRQIGVEYKKACPEAAVGFQDSENLTVPAVRLIHSICSFMEFLGEHYCVELRIPDGNNIDDASAAIIDYLAELDTITIIM